MTVQQKLCNNKWFRLGVSVILTLAVVLVFVLAPFATAHAIAGAESDIITVIIAALAACGITFATTGDFDTLTEYVADLLSQYAQYRQVTFNSLTNGIQMSVNKAGKLLLNGKLVEVLQGFAEWIIDTFTLTDNNNVNIQSGGMVNGLQLYDTSIVIKWSYAGSTFKYVFFEVVGACMLVFHTRYISGVEYIEPLAFSDEPFTIKVTTFNGSSVSDEVQYTAALNVNSYFANMHTPSIKSSYWASDNPSVIYYNNTVSQLKGYLDGQAVPEDDIDINVGTINLPADNPNYTQGYGGMLDVGAGWSSSYPGAVSSIPSSWGLVQNGEANPSLDYASEADIAEQLPELSDVENMPGGSTFTLPNGFGNLRLSDIWYYVHQWVVDTAVAGGLLWNTATVMASPVVNMAYAMVVIAIVFGVMKQLRSH